MDWSEKYKMWPRYILGKTEMKLKYGFYILLPSISEFKTYRLCKQIPRYFHIILKIYFIYKNILGVINFKAFLLLIQERQLLEYIIGKERLKNPL